MDFSGIPNEHLPVFKGKNTPKIMSFLRASKIRNRHHATRHSLTKLGKKKSDTDRDRSKVLLRTTNDASLILTSTHHPPRNKEVTMATVGDPPDGSEDAGDSGNSRRAAKAGSNDVSVNYFCVHFGE